MDPEPGNSLVQSGIKHTVCKRTMCEVLEN